MTFDLTEMRLSHKIAMLMLGVALFAVVAIGTIGDWMLRSLATDFAQARSPMGIAMLERMNDTGGSVAAARVVMSDGRVGILLTRAEPTELAPTPVVLTAQEATPPSTIVMAAQPAAESTTVATMRTNLFLTCVAVLAIVGLLGFFAARVFTDPLSRLVTDLDRLAKGDTSVKFTEGWRHDEIGDISRSAESFRSNITELKAIKARASGRVRTTAPGSRSGSAFLTSLREQWATTKDLFIGEWNNVTWSFRHRPAAEARSVA